MNFFKFLCSIIISILLCIFAISLIRFSIINDFFIGIIIGGFIFISVIPILYEKIKNSYKCIHGIWGANGNISLCAICTEIKLKNQRIFTAREQSTNNIDKFFKNNLKSRVDKQTYFQLVNLKEEAKNHIMKENTLFYIIEMEFIENFNRIYDDYFLKKERLRTQKLEQKKQENYENKEKYLEMLKDGKNQLEYYKNSHNLSKDELGKRYERYIGYLYEKDGWIVDYHGITKKREDRGIDLIAKKKKKILLIQCKMYGVNTLVRENTINQLFGTYASYKRLNTKDEIIPILITQNDNLDENANDSLGRFLEILHSVIPFTYNYPLIKCKMSENKIYHLPTDPMYDLIKIKINRKDFYCETIEEAEKNGFRRRLI